MQCFVCHGLCQAYNTQKRKGYNLYYTPGVQNDAVDTAFSKHIHTDNSPTVSVLAVLGPCSNTRFSDLIRCTVSESEGILVFSGKEKTRMAELKQTQDTSTQGYSYTLLRDQEEHNQPLLQPSAPIQPTYYQQDFTVQPQPAPRTGVHYHTRPYPAVSGSIQKHHHNKCVNYITSSLCSHEWS